MNLHELCCTDICMHFTHKKALDGATVQFKTGSIHALLGENGAGKSTLAHIISGLLKPTSGSITYDDKPLYCGNGAKPRIFMVHQNPKLAEDFSVWQNALLAAQKSALKPYNKKAFAAQLEQICASWNFQLNLNKKINSLNDSERFYAALLCRLAGKPDFLILDEPTATLDAAQRAAFFDSLKKARAQNLGVIYISHNLEETIKLCDTISILRKGVCKATLDNIAYNTKESEILQIMFGGESQKTEGQKTEAHQTEKHADLKVSVLKNEKQKVLVVRNLATSIKNKKNLAGISFECGAGEITVIKGEKNGGIALLENILTGINPPEYSGFIELFGEKLKKITPALLRKNGVGIVSSKKYLVSSNPNLTVKELLMPFLAGDGFSHCKKDAEAVQSMIEAEKIDISADEPVSNLSGGMLQRLILARELAPEPKLLILADPLYGLDYKTVRYLEDRLTAAASAGTAVVVLMADADDGFSKWNCLYEIKEGQIHKGNDL